MGIFNLTLNIILICISIITLIGTIFAIKIAHLYYKEFVKERFGEE